MVCISVSGLVVYMSSMVLGVVVMCMSVLLLVMSMLLLCSMVLCGSRIVMFLLVLSVVVRWFL